MHRDATRKGLDLEDHQITTKLEDKLEVGWNECNENTTDVNVTTGG